MKLAEPLASRYTDGQLAQIARETFPGGAGRKKALYNK